MRASDLVVLLEQKIKEHGDFYMTYAVEESMYGMEAVNEIEVVPHHETKYFCIK